MGLKHFVLGVGIGVVMTSLIFFATSRLSASDNDLQEVTLSDEEIIDRAYALGMVQITNQNSVDKSGDKTVEETEVNSSLVMPDNQGQMIAISDERLVELAAELGMVFPGEPVGEMVGEPLDEPENQENESLPVEEIVNFRVIPGMTARTIAKLLQNNDIIDDAAVFEDYLVAQGVQSILRSGYFSIPKGTPFSEITRILSTTPKYR